MEERIICWLKENRLIWMILFTALFILSIDLWNWELDLLVFGFLPIWVLRLLILQVLLSIMIYLFVKFYWRE